jgi:hypothetical protein
MRPASETPCLEPTGSRIGKPAKRSYKASGPPRALGAAVGRPSGAALAFGTDAILRGRKGVNETPYYNHFKAPKETCVVRPGPTGVGGETTVTRDMDQPSIA